MSQNVIVDGVEVKLTNLEKVLWPEGFTKADLIAYYHEMAPYILPYILDRPAVMSRYPHGIEGESFYQKDCPDYAPGWIRTVAVKHNEGRKTVNYIVHQDRATLVWLANQTAIELHAWLSRVNHLRFPDIAVVDLDPAEGASFDQVIAVALLVREALREYGIDGRPKTSGATGMHIYIPLEPRYGFAEVTAAIKTLARMITEVCPFATTERVVAKRTGRVYIDYLQNGFGRTMTWVYSVRPRSGAPVSMPLEWGDLEHPEWKPGDFTIGTVPSIVKTKGDAFHGLFSRRYTLDGLLKATAIWENR